MASRVKQAPGSLVLVAWSRARERARPQDDPPRGLTIAPCRLETQWDLWQALDSDAARALKSIEPLAG